MPCPAGKARQDYPSIPQAMIGRESMANSARVDRSFVKKCILAGLFAAAAMLTATMGAQAGNTIRFGIAAEPYPPFYSKDSSGKWLGWEIDLMDAICAEMKDTKCELVETAWDGIIPALQANKIDVIWASMTITDKRRETIDFTSFYYDSPIVIIGAKADTTKLDLARADSAKGKVFGAQTATIHEDYLKARFGAAAEVKIYDTLDNALADLAAGRVDYVNETKSALSPFLTSDRGKDFEIKIVCPQDSILGYGIGGGIRKGDTALKDKLNAALKTVVANGKWDAITAKYSELNGLMVKPN
jgi:polar amino acid transport system substrate-binding protein